MMNIRVEKYDPKYDPAISALEDRVVQGKQVRLKIIKEHFLDRSAVFSSTYPCLCINGENLPVGTSIGVETRIGINGSFYRAGFAFDVKVDPGFRNRGLGRRMARFIYQNFFNPGGLEKNFTTLKASNIPVIRLVSKTVGNIWLYDFVYLTIPVDTIIRNEAVAGTGVFKIDLFEKEDISSDYFTELPCGLGFFHTWKIYRLKIEKISWLYRQGLKLAKMMDPSYLSLPGENEIMDFATLFNHNTENIGSINNVLEELRGRGKKFLLVCCRKNDGIYNFLKKYSVNTYGYYLLADFEINKKDSVSIDVRCL